MNLQRIDGDDHTLYIARNLSSKFLMTKVEVHFGECKKTCSIRQLKTLPTDSVALSKTFAYPFTLPENIPYELKITGNTLTIGPIIGIISTYNRFFSWETGRLNKYDEIKGLVFVCEEADVDIKKRSIKGYWFNRQKSTWSEGMFPYPDVWFNRYGNLDKHLNHSLRLKKDHHIINSKTIDKWDQYKIIQKISSEHPVMPRTERFSMENLVTMLRECKEVYLKETNRADGHGIMMIRIQEKGFLLIDHKNHSTQFTSLRLLYNQLLQIENLNNYLIQQSVAYRFNSQNLDFRIYLQKNESHEWFSPGFFSRVSKKDSIITNYKNRERISPGNKALKQIYKLTESAAKEKEKEMFQISKKICEAIENTGIHLGDIAVDIILDQQLHIWVLEVQVIFGIEPKLSFVDQHLTGPLYYAKSLAGYTK
ncbi:YheC/YheD family protein [Halobacillus sp. Marseille-Q1614]|uniref:YheC/YheD family protein n=1 Tax=Halobacillus sp. Marseille-Q1614 TaxID=2709134 RepID=UPI00156DC4EA|nr:YheC/YheD family protein [Halobacillus sp. Marseille-Q1614]